MKKKLFSGILIGIVMLSLTFNFVIAFQKSNAINDINSYDNIEKLDDNNCLIHSGNAFSKSDLLITKEANLDKFDYKFFDVNSKNEVYTLSSTQDIDFHNSKIFSNNNFYAAVIWATIDALRNGENLTNVLADKFGKTLTSAAIGGLVKAVVTVSIAGMSDMAAYAAVMGAFISSTSLWTVVLTAGAA